MDYDSLLDPKLMASRLPTSEELDEFRAWKKKATQHTDTAMGRVASIDLQC
jgi:hypothetical protein